MSLWRTFRDLVLGSYDPRGVIKRGGKEPPRPPPPPGASHHPPHHHMTFNPATAAGPVVVDGTVIGTQYTPPAPDPTTPPPAPADPPKHSIRPPGRFIAEIRPDVAVLARRFQEEVEQHLVRPDVVVGQTLAAAYDYLAYRGWLDGPRPKVMSTAPRGDWWDRIVLVITDPPSLDPDLWAQLREHRDCLTCVVRP